MKKVIIALYWTIVASVLSLNAQDFEPVLAATLVQFENDSTIEMMAATVNRFEMIAGKWNDQWLAYYYVAYGESVFSYIEKDEKRRDAWLDKAEIHLQQAEQLYGQESDELYVLRALIASARLSVKPGERWKRYGAIFDRNITLAKSLNSSNPRIYYLQGNSLYYTPKMFGGGPKNAMPFYEEADSLYRQVTIDSLGINPSWGRLQNTQMLEKCKGSVNSE
jgi:hypothetical protein